MALFPPRGPPVRRAGMRRKSGMGSKKVLMVSSPSRIRVFAKHDDRKWGRVKGSRDLRRLLRSLGVAGIPKKSTMSYMELRLAASRHSSVLNSISMKFDGRKLSSLPMKDLQKIVRILTPSLPIKPRSKKNAIRSLVAAVQVKKRKKV